MDACTTIRHLRALRGLSQQKLADAARIPRRQLQRIEKGQPPKLDSLVALLDVLAADDATKLALISR